MVHALFEKRVKFGFLLLPPYLVALFVGAVGEAIESSRPIVATEEVITVLGSLIHAMFWEGFDELFPVFDLPPFYWVVVDHVFLVAFYCFIYCHVLEGWRGWRWRRDGI